MYKFFAAFMLSALVFTACSPMELEDSEEVEDGGEELEEVVEESEEEDGEALELPEGDFAEVEPGYFEGTVYVKGYGEAKRAIGFGCTPENWGEDCPEDEELNFFVTEMGSDVLAEYRGEKPVILLGCLKDGSAEGINANDEYMENNDRALQPVSLGEDLTARILAADEENPIVLELTKEPFSGGFGAPMCYNNFTSVKEYKG